MTRRGSLAYYLAAVVVGCFFAAAFTSLAMLRYPGERNSADFFGFYFISLLFGAFAAILFAGALRRLMVWRGWMRSWQWILWGAAVATLVVAGLAALGLGMARIGYEASFYTSFLLMGPLTLAGLGLWPATLAGALTAIVLHRIHRAFEPREETRAQT